jgi:hypothetical protein
MADLWRLREVREWAAEWRRYYEEKGVPEKYVALIQKRSTELRAALDSAKGWMQSAGMPSKREATISVRWLEREARRATKVFGP